MPLILVFGTRWHYQPVPGGFHGGLSCPTCQRVTPFVEVHAKEAFTLYWWPVWTVTDGGRLVRCEACGDRFEAPPELEAHRGVARAARRERPAG